MRNFSSRTLQTTIIFLIAGGVVALAFGGYFSSASNVFTGSLVNLQTWFSTRFTAVQDFLTAPRDMASLRQRNTELESEVAELQSQVIQLQQQVGDTQILAALVDFERARPENTYRAAGVIGRDPSPFLHYVIIASLSGSVTGDVSLDLIPQDTNIQQGDLVLTSGLGGGYPPDLIVGQVVNVRTREFDLFQQATVQPVVDFNRLQIVLVIVNFKPVDITPLAPTP